LSWPGGGAEKEIRRIKARIQMIFEKNDLGLRTMFNFTPVFAQSPIQGESLFLI
jgi:hypothetical protein